MVFTLFLTLMMKRKMYSIYFTYIVLVFYKPSFSTRQIERLLFLNKICRAFRQANQNALLSNSPIMQISPPTLVLDLI